MKSFVKLYKKSFRHHDFVSLVNNPPFLSFLELPSLTAPEWSDLKLFFYSNGFIIHRMDNSIISYISKNSNTETKVSKKEDSSFLQSFSGNMYVVYSNNNNISDAILNFKKITEKYSYLRLIGFLFNSQWISPKIFSKYFKDFNSSFSDSVSSMSIVSTIALSQFMIFGYLLKKTEEPSSIVSE